MASSEDSLDSDISNWLESEKCKDRFFINCEPDSGRLDDHKANINVVHKLFNRQMYGRFTRHPKAATERIFSDIYYKCRYKLDQIIPKEDALSHIFMGFTLCGKYIISYTTRISEPSSISSNLLPTFEYDLHIWRFVPGQQMQYVAKHRIFKLFKSSIMLDEVAFMQFPLDPYKIICYAIASGSPSMTFLTILTLPSKHCRNCRGKQAPQSTEHFARGWCEKHGFMLHFMFSVAQPTPSFDPNLALAYPGYIVINTVHCIHVLNVSTLEPSRPFIATFHEKDFGKIPILQSITWNYSDTISEVSESPSELFSGNSVVDAILEDFSEYDLEGNDYNKPFHELNISCEPPNVTGKNYHNALVQNIVDTHFSIPQSSGLQKSEKSKIDKKIAEKAYEFIEENEKCEKLSLFRKKRLADKKYEFSEDNSENIVPFYSLRREKRCFYRLRSPELNSLFLSPRSPNLRSPMQSPSSRSQFSPGSARGIYCSVIRNHYSKSPISPKDSARKFNVYSPGLESDCSDSDSRLVLRQVHNFPTSHPLECKSQHTGLLIVDSKRDDTPKWIKKVVKRYSSVDFENSSLLSGQSRDDYNIPIEIPLLVQTLTEQQLDIVPEVKADQIAETQLIITQHSCDCDQFVQSWAQKLCMDAQLEFLHCEDYDIKVLYICPLSGILICKAVITIGALQDLTPYGRRNLYVAQCIFSWNIASNKFEVLEPPLKYKLQTQWCRVPMPMPKIPSIVHQKVLVMEHISSESKHLLRDYNNYFEICLGRKLYDVSGTSDEECYDEYSIPSDSD